jgi:NAD(P)-dependent dehydrogenase (short-subunit alcohol dehydrogenase family)
VGRAQDGGRAPVEAEDGPNPPVGRVALVSGGNRGLGLRIVRTLAERGMRVVLGSRSLARGHAAISALGDLADRVALRQLDVTDAASVAQLAFWLRRRLGRCDVLVNNAAVLMDEDSDTTVNVALEVVRRTLETNLIGTWRLTQAVAPIMRSGRYGRIVIVSSGLGSLATMRSGAPAYRVSKCAVNAVTRMLADELARDGILVNACSPDPERTGSVDNDQPTLLPASEDTPVWLATLPDDGPTGGFYRWRTMIDW